MPATRVPWNNFPKLITHSAQSALVSHPAYKDANAGDLQAAFSVVTDIVRDIELPAIPDFIAPVISFNQDGSLNAIPYAFGALIAKASGAKLVMSIVRDTMPEPFDAPSLIKLVSQPTFSGNVPKGSYFIVNDVTDLGKNLANLRGFIHASGSHVIAASSLSAGIFAASLVPEPHILYILKTRFKNDLNVFTETLGFDVDCLTNREAHLTNGLKHLQSLRNPTELFPHGHRHSL